MDKVTLQKSELDAIRQEIDEIDQQMVDLLCARFAATEKVRLAKASGPQTGVMPYRPGREAIILRRLLEQAGGDVPAGLVERVWRAIISASVMRQADVRIITTDEVMKDARYRAALDLFAAMVPIEKAGSLKAALEALHSSEPVLVVLPMKADWHRAIHKPSDRGVPRVVSVLTGGGTTAARALVVLGHAMSEPTGEDETMLMTAGKLPRDFVPKPVWYLKVADDIHLTALPGYMSVSEQPLVGLKGNTGLALKVTGRYPSPIGMDEE